MIAGFLEFHRDIQQRDLGIGRSKQCIILTSKGEITSLSASVADNRVGGQTFVKIALYQYICISDISTLKILSLFVGRLWTTSFFSRRSMMDCNLLCKSLIFCSFSSSMVHTEQYLIFWVKDDSHAPIRCRSVAYLLSQNVLRIDQTFRAAKNASKQVILKTRRKRSTSAPQSQTKHETYLSRYSVMGYQWLGAWLVCWMTSVPRTVVIHYSWVDEPASQTNVKSWETDISQV